MFRSTKREALFPQSEHARLAGAIALAWGNEQFHRPALPFASFVAGVTLHDRAATACSTRTASARARPSDGSSSNSPAFASAAAIRSST